MRLMIRSMPPEGFTDRRRAGRAWPRAGVAVEVIDGDEDGPPPVEGEVLKIGRKTLEALRGDAFITVGVEDLDEVPRLKARIAELEAQLAALVPVAPPAGDDAKDDQPKASKKAK